MTTITNPAEAWAEDIAQRVVRLLEARQQHAGQRLLNVREAAQYLGMSTQQLRRRTASGDVPNVRFGKRGLRFDREVLARWVEQHGGRG